MDDDRDRFGFLEMEEESAAEFTRHFKKVAETGAVREVPLNARFRLEKSQEGSMTVVFEEACGGSKRADGWCVDVENAWVVELRAGTHDFGMIILPKNDNSPPDKQLPANLASSAVSSARILGRILGSEFGTSSDTCLPIHRPAGNRKLPIVFADIRNFSTVTRILRLMGRGQLAAMELLMEHYCQVMARLANEWGRLDKFMGDGLMAIFGEEILPVATKTDTRKGAPERSVLSAACFAVAALGAFKEIVRVWLRDELSSESLAWRFPGKIEGNLLKHIKKEHCEDIHLSLGIAINFGAVHMDYFGDTRGRAYSAIGDNVNLTARLCDMAAKHDPEMKRELAPILVTQPAFEYLREFLTQDAQKRLPLRLQMRGLGLDYPIWELRPADLAYGRAVQCFQGTRQERVFANTFELCNHALPLKAQYIESLRLCSKESSKTTLSASHGEVDEGAALQ